GAPLLAGPDRGRDGGGTGLLGGHGQEPGVPRAGHPAAERRTSGRWVPVSIDDQRDLYERLDLAVGTIVPREAPVDGAMRRGRGIKVRRRVVLAAGVAAVVAAGVVAVPWARHTAS